MRQLKNKWLLLDANVVIELALNSNHPFWSSFSKQIRSLNCKTIITPEIQFELFRRVQSEGDSKTLITLLEESGIKLMSLPRKNGWLTATRIGQIYALKKLNGISSVDCLLAAYLKSYQDNLYLATFNNRDFPVTLFDRVGMLNFEIKNEIKVLGVYQFSPQKYQTLERGFKKSQAAKF